MRNRHVALCFSLLLVVGLVLTGCSPRAGAGSTADTFQGSDLVVDLPALVIDYDAEGTPSIAGTPLTQLAVLPPDVVNQLVLPKNIIDMMVSANIQHLQISNTPGGLKILVNGEQIPSLVWDAQSLANVAELAPVLSASVPAALQGILPIIGNLGAGAVVRFPLAQGADVLPLAVEGDSSAAATAKAAQEAFLAEAGTQPAIIIPVTYATDGTWTVQGIAMAEWQALTGLPFGALKLESDVIEGAVAAGITGATVRTDAQGIHIALNGKELPYLSWENGEINHTLSLAQQAGLLAVLGSGEGGSAVLGLVESLLPAVQSTNLSIQVAFPAP